MAVTHVEARWFNRSVLRTQVDLIVVHCMETADRGPGVARRVAKWMAGPGAPKASAHWLCDDREVVMSVPSERIAWHAPGANSVGVGVELAGMAFYSREKWTDPYSSNVLWTAAAACALDVHRYKVPVMPVDVGMLRTFYGPGRRTFDPIRARGFCTHAMVTEAFPEAGSGHTDPGPDFPLEELLELVRASVRLERWRSLL